MLELDTALARQLSTALGLPSDRSHTALINTLLDQLAYLSLTDVNELLERSESGYVLHNGLPSSTQWLLTAEGLGHEPT